MVARGGHFAITQDEKAKLLPFDNDDDRIAFVAEGVEPIGAPFATGHMEPIKEIIYSFSAFVRSEDGTAQPFLVEISAPEDTGKGDSVCSVSCPFLRAKPFSIFGVDHAQAVELSRRFIEANLEHMNVRLVDAGGNPVALPPVPAAGL